MADQRDINIDIIKGLAILSVLMQHSLLPAAEKSIYLQYTIFQAVPIFLLISGYLYARSYKRSNTTTLKGCYDSSMIYHRIKRLYLPFIFIYIIEVIVVGNYNWLFILSHFFLGGLGIGKYYLVVMFQFIFLFPIIYIITLKSRHSIPIIFAVAVLFEICVSIFSVPESIYYFLIGRYIFAIGLGAYLGVYKSIDSKLLYIGGILGAIYIYAAKILNYQIFGHGFQLPYQAPAYLYTIFLFFILNVSLQGDKKGTVLRSIGKLGTASWHIFLVQMIYFMIPHQTTSGIFYMVYSILLCCVIGYAFYLILDHFIKQ